MPSRLGKRKDYNLVDDAYDNRVPIHNDDAFQHGISFKAKYIGTLDVPRPTGRMEIVVAMRRIRYEFKAKSIKKRKVNIKVSTEGVRVVLRKKKKKKEWSWDLDRMLIMHDPIYRIFYVSHDSHDLKIWSYIARDGASNVFRCNVFKSPKKSSAMHIVRTVGQAFEVCHKLNIGPPPKKDDKPAIADKDKEEESGDKGSDKMDESKLDRVEEIVTPIDSTTSNGELDARTAASLSSDGKPPLAAKDSLLLQSASEPISIQAINSKTPLSTHHQLQLSQQKILQAEQQTEVAVAQVHLLKDQLAAETTARIEAQARNHQLLVQNRELLQQLSELVAKFSDVEAKLNNTVNDHQLSAILGKVVVDPTTPASGGIQDVVLLGTDLTKVSPFVDTSLFENTNANTGNSPIPNLSKLSNGMLVTGADTSTSTITKSSMGSGSVRAKSRGKANMEGSGSSSDSSSDEEEALGAAIRLASESGTVRSNALDNLATSLANGSAIGDQTVNTSIWTSGLVTPERILTGQGYQQSAVSFNDTSLSTTVNDTSLSNGYTLSPIFTMGTNNESQSSFQHFSVTEADDSLRIGDTPTSVAKKSMKKSFSTSAEMHSQERTAPSTSHSSGDLVRSNLGGLIRWTKVSEKETPWEESLQDSQLHESPNKSSDLNTTPRIGPPPTRMKRMPSSRSQPEYRPRPDAQNNSELTTSPSRVPEDVASPKLVDTSDSDLEVPTKLAKYNQGVKMSQSSYAYGSDPLLSPFDPLLAKSKSFDHQSPTVPRKEPTTESLSTALSPIQDVGQKNPFLYITPQTPESSKYCKPVNPEELSKSYSDLEQSSTLYISGIFSSPQEYETRLRYEPLRKQQASEWHPSTATTTELRLNSSFHAGDKKEVTFNKSKLQDTARDLLPVYRTYSDLPSTVTPTKKKLTTVASEFTNENILTTTTVHSIGSFNSNNSNSKAVEKIPKVQLKTVDVLGDGDHKGNFKEPPSVDGNISLLDDLFISETEQDSGLTSRKIPVSQSAINASCVRSTENDKKNLSEEMSLLDDIMGRMTSQNESSNIPDIGKSISVKSTKTGIELGADTRVSEHDATNSSMPDFGRLTPTSESHPTSVGSNSDSGVSGCGGFKPDHTILSVLSDTTEH